MSSIDLDDDLIFFTLDSLDSDDDDDNNCNKNDSSCKKSDSFISTHSSFIERVPSTTNMASSNKKMSDITDFLDSTEFNDKQDNIDLISTNVLDYLRRQSNQNTFEKYQWESEESYLKYGSKQLSPSDYLARKSLYNRPVAFEKDSRQWARSLLDNFKKSNQNCKSKSSLNFSYYLPVIKKSSSFDRHVQYVEHLNECNDYQAYLEYIRENRSELFYTLTDSIDIIDGLIGTVV